MNNKTKEEIEEKIADVEMDIYIHGNQSDSNFEKLNRLKSKLNYAIDIGAVPK